MEQLLAEYFVNSTWQILLLALGAWLLLRVLRPSPLIQHRIWLGVLPLLLLMPFLSLHGSGARQDRVGQAPTEPMPSVNLADGLDLPIPTQLLEHAAADDPRPAPSQASIPAPEPSDSWQSKLHLPVVPGVSLGPAATVWVVGFYLATMAFALIRLSCAWLTARRVIARAASAELSRGESLLVDRCCRRLGVPRPTILESPEVRSPMVVGVLRPLLLLPVGFANRPETSAQQSNRDLEAVFLHELAHLQRRDCLANFVCRVIALPISYHPATWAVRQRIRQTQEMLCDAIAAGEMQSPVRYARCLVGLAQNMQRNDVQIAQIYGSTMFDGKILEERVMQLIQTRKTANLRTQVLRFACGIAVVVAVMSAAATFHVTPTFAETPVLSQPAVATQTVDQTSRTGQSSPADTAIETDASGSSQQLDQASQQFDAAMRIVRSHLNRSSNSLMRDTDMAAMHAEIRQQADETGIEGRVGLAQQAAKSAQIAAEIARAHAKFNSPEFQKQMADMQAKFNSPEFKQKIKDAQSKFDSAEFKQKMKEAQSKFDDPEFKKKMADMQAKFNSPEFKQKMKDAQAKFDTPEFKKRMADMESRLNSAEFKQRIAEAQARFDNPEFRRKMEIRSGPEFQRQIAAATAKANNPELRKQLEDLNQKYREQLQQILRQFSETPTPSAAPSAP